MSATSKPTSEFARRGAARHPVLARLPDVSTQPASPAHEGRDHESGEYIDYRFDSPPGEEDVQPMRRLGQQRGFQPPVREARSKIKRTPPRILPDSDPFSLQTTSIYERLEPVARFLMLFALFTAAGTMLLIYQGTSRKGVETNRPAPGATPALLAVPAEQVGTAAIEVERSKAEPTASGPLSADPTSSANGLPEQDGERIANRRKRETLKPPAKPMLPTLATATGDALPRVQTTEPRSAEIVLNPVQPVEPTEQPVVARLPGIIREVPQQARHDDNQPGLH